MVVGLYFFSLSP